MAGSIKGITIKFEGDTTKLDGALRKIKGKSTEVNKELKAVNNALKFNPNNVQLVTQKQQLLNDKIKTTKQQLEDYKNAQKQLKPDGTEEEQKAWRQLEREIIQAESRVKYFEKELKVLNSQKLKELGDEFKKVGDKASSLGKTMTTTTTAPIVAGFAYAVKEASDFEENLNKVDVAFGKSADSVMEWANTATESFGLSKNSALEMTAQFGDMGTSMGISQKEAAAMSTELAGLAGDLASFKNISTDQAMTALNGVFTGETESLKTLGVVMTQTNLEAFAQKQGLVYKEMSEAEKVTLRYQYVLEKTKNAQGDYANTADGTANSIRTFRESISNLAIVIGENLLPIITPIIQKLTDIVQKFGEMSPAMQKVVIIIATVAAAIGPVLIIFGTLASAIGTIIPLLGAFSIAAAAPFIGIAAAIAGLIAGGVMLYKNWDKVKAKALELGKAIKDRIGKAAENAKSSFKSLGSSLVSPFRSALSKIKSIIDKIKSFFPIKIGKIMKGIKLPHFSLNMGSKDFGKLGSVKYPKGLNVKWYRTGGIVDGATLIGAGENGPEAIVPLSGKEMKPFTDAVSDNLGGMQFDYEKLAAAIVGAFQNIVTTTVLNVDGRAIAETTAPYMSKSINALQARENRKLGIIGGY